MDLEDFFWTLLIVVIAWLLLVPAYKSKQKYKKDCEAKWWIFIYQARWSDTCVPKWSLLLPPH